MTMMIDEYIYPCVFRSKVFFVMLCHCYVNDFCNTYFMVAQGVFQIMPLLFKLQRIHMQMKLFGSIKISYGMNKKVQNSVIPLNLKIADS